ncbi:hypothetical protein DSM106972_017600 [Dulcicalothrix desertica PCC 7102]|uniref:GGDEF domain-containing protein n=1 Tax=Dulcicalothrix desertica PCC 7102 TaxID=232991 RepID=A0A433VRD5_9CYAN|nr:AAA-like domain-containing protein [Dulcicalothrix desertica]RUT08592.1 hypothetical protein DSM106972_017600 [Dulcicalothrix desertica PCC 7102]TWH44068.1 diguanylate cyclase (GGDEF)-like protein [Dulcicalothrix desertica PCC 7102]
MRSIAKEPPDEALHQSSIFYIERPPIEATVCQEITKEGCIIRIKSPQKMGKTSLVLRLMKYAKKVLYATVYIDFQQADKDILCSEDKFFRWLCANISKQLQLNILVNQYWDSEIGNKVNCTLYLKNYILQQLNVPLVLVLNKLDYIFEYPIATSFLTLLRSWHDAKYDVDLKQIRLVLVHSTEIYISLNINQSPFNVGLLVELPEFTTKQIQELALRYGLNWSSTINNRYAFQLKSLLGGHPYLVRMFIHNLVNNPNSTFDELLEQSHTYQGIYNSYLRGILATVIQHPELVTALKDLMYHGEIFLNNIVAYKLESLGLIKVNSQCTFSCELYKKYFATQNFEELNVWRYMKKLQKDNKTLRSLSNTDELTQLNNRRYFDTMLHQLWFMLVEKEAPMSMIILDIDHLKIYNQSYDRIKGDDCIKKIANVIQEVVSDFSKVGLYQIQAVRYSGGEFAILLPGKTLDIAIQVAEIIRTKVKDLNILQTQKYFGLTAPIVTISLGVICAVTNADKSPIKLMEMARQALYQSKNDGRDCISVDIY